jgi:exonuclease III
LFYNLRTKLLPEYPTIKFAVSTAKKGYSGVCVLAKARLPDSGSPRDSQDTTNASPAKKSIQPSLLALSEGLGEFGGGYLDEGRVLTMEFEEFFLTFAYVPNRYGLCAFPKSRHAVSQTARVHD